MSDSDFQKRVISSLDDILNYLTEPDRDSIELRRITSNQGTLIQTLESELRKLKIEFLKMKDDNEELLSILKDRQTRIISLENNLRNLNTLCLESEDSIETIGQSGRKDEVPEINAEIRKVIIPKQAINEEGFELLDSENWDFPEILLEHRGFSLSELKEKKIKKKEIVHAFKIFILVLTHIMNADDPEGYNEFLDLRKGDIDDSLIQEVYIKWKASKWEGSYIDKLYDSLVKIPQENRYTKLIEKFEELIS